VDLTMPIKPKSHAQRQAELRPRRPDDRPSSAARGYGHRWRKLRRLQLNRHPLCQWPGCERPATDVDHILARARGGGDEEANLQSLCHRHHSEKTARHDGAFGHERTDDDQEDGCPR
jgi:5-methylcytosine-specific restriction protein A